MTAAFRASTRGAMPAAMAEAAWLATALLTPIAMNAAAMRGFESFKLTLIMPLAVLAWCCALADPAGLHRFNNATLRAAAISFGALIAAAALATVLSPAAGVAWQARPIMRGYANFARPAAAAAVQCTSPLSVSTTRPHPCNCASGWCFRSTACTPR